MSEEKGPVTPWVDQKYFTPDVMALMEQFSNCFLLPRNANDPSVIEEVRIINDNDALPASEKEKQITNLYVLSIMQQAKILDGDTNLSYDERIEKKNILYQDIDFTLWLAIADKMCDENGAMHFVPFFQYLYENRRIPYSSKYSQWKWHMPHENNSDKNDSTKYLREECFTMPILYKPCKQPERECGCMGRTFLEVLSRILYLIPETQGLSDPVEGIAVSNEDRRLNDLQIDRVLSTVSKGEE